MAERLRHADLLQIHPVANGYVVRHPATGAVHHLNDTAALLFELCDGRSTADEVIGTVRKLYGLSAGALRTVRQGLGELRHHGLVVGASPVPAAAPKMPGDARTRRPRKAGRHTTSADHATERGSIRTRRRNTP
jgi:PqqD family protein of HPr-rel-A system